MGLSTGKAFSARLRDSREVLIRGQRAEDVTAHPATAALVREVGAFYDLQRDPAAADVLTVPAPSGADERLHRAHVSPRTAADLRARGDAFARFGETTFGMLGRAPDYTNTLLATLASFSGYFGQTEPRYADNLRRFHEHVQRNDLFISHSLTGPQREKRAPQPGVASISLQAVGETSAGVLVSGFRTLATNSPVGDELLCFGFAGRPLVPGEEAKAIYFAVPTATPGMRLVCREPWARSEDFQNHPLAARFDELDATIHFDRVLVPWERVFLYRDLALSNGFIGKTRLLDHAGQHVLTRSKVRLDACLAMAHSLIEHAGLGDAFPIQARMGKLLSARDAMEACLRAAEALAEVDLNGNAVPCNRFIQAGVQMNQRIWPEVFELLETCGASGLIQAPTTEELDGPASSALSSLYGGDAEAKQLLGAYRLAWDMVGSAYGSRVKLFERFSQGDPDRAFAKAYLTHPKDGWSAQVARMLGSDR